MTNTQNTLTATTRRGFSFPAKLTVLAVISFATLCGAMALSTGQSEAFSSQSSGPYSTVTITNKVYGSSTNIGFDSWLRYGASSAQRLSAYPNSSQRICAEFRVWRSQGGSATWIRMYRPGGDMWCATVTQGTVNFPAVTYTLTAGFVYTAQINYTWQVNGTLVASKLVDYNHATDYQCVSAGLACTASVGTGRGGIWLGF